MSKELQRNFSSLDSSSKPQQPPIPSLTHQGDNGVQIFNQPGASVNFYSSNAIGPVYNAAHPLNTDFYNLIVVEEASNNSPAIIAKDRALTLSEGVAKEISTQFAGLTQDAVTLIKTFPSLLVGKNKQCGCTANDHLAYFGVVTDVIVQESCIAVHFQAICSFYQQILNDTAERLGLLCAPMANELDRPHWAIKQVNLIEELRALGITIPAMT